ncbi:MAG: trypsin-like peptidase domain-containing protein [Chloroflexi bacterium]|uniref:S1C family serine protease n=1 Tax=Candidatus Chlorohelix allophototropha TaxID=3003348 RepID=A0A8T7M8A6_9CHLR|nr:trypsin-like peptidase domain-containing protein [Chloroflexota bacterium]NWJ49199.1 trypsin-like peptidase domain-containing protein [Chloroflexota bacterium]WJW68321.1 S1C family serine protease [Chloroflexota bacterium L227-S17]
MSTINYQSNQPPNNNPLPPVYEKKPNHWAKPVKRGLLALALMFTFGTGYFIADNLNNNNVSAPVYAPVAAASIPTNIIALQTNQTLTVAQVAQKVCPTVVQITSQVTTSSNRFSAGSGSTQATGVGSGIIIDSAGYILINYHVIENTNSLEVTLSDGTTLEATVVGSKPQNDLAVIKIDPTGSELTVAELGDSSVLQVGDELAPV